MTQYELLRLFYPDPIQVRYLKDDMSYGFGIAYQEIIIDAETGEVISIPVVTRRALDPDNTIIERTWADLRPAFGEMK